MNIQGKKILITGGSGGFGRGMAQVLSVRGGEVWITGRNQDKLNQTAQELNIHAVKADAALPSDWDKVMSQVGRLDILINNAGSGGRIAPVAGQSDEEIIKSIHDNLIGAMLGCRRAAQIMTAAKRGMIINVSSVCALYAWPGWAVYTAAKAGLSKFSHGLYTELRSFGVRVCCVTPSWGQTDFNVAAAITGAAEDPALRQKCIAPAEIGELIAQLIELPDHLSVPDVTLQPMIQDICPM